MALQERAGILDASFCSYKKASFFFFSFRRTRNSSFFCILLANAAVCKQRALSCAKGAVLGAQALAASLPSASVIWHMSMYHGVNNGSLDGLDADHAQR